MSLKDIYLDRHSGDPIEAAAAMARDLNRDNPKTFQVGYTPENAILAAQDTFPEVSAESIRKINGWVESDICRKCVMEHNLGECNHRRAES